MVQEFVLEVESGLGFIFKEDVKKYWRHLHGEDISQEMYDELLECLGNANLLK